MTGNDLRRLGYRPTDARWKLNSKFDRLIRTDMETPGGLAAQTLRCCDVVGIA